ncbi:uncharacterized protein PITG_08981 [Phytophthora infestans T30-4]|uniref:Uncharacterized protein n=1 Tax=Phytophthora infestans (strain T30-4) TaxID=403677 RepID=D0NDN1_PHYIT|nr:uncharacterized protein PITG_08981 [Phytophthora infestans T30-4]EEY56188.1 hypothetical protein PITG_08981 [Phytophthora infestans T30-4]|eukprot:XP_002903018.1 hypothetical protein PITG_08981 [Phytophthora infestans T30-4]
MCIPGEIELTQLWRELCKDGCKHTRMAQHHHYVNQGSRAGWTSHDAPSAFSRIKLAVKHGLRRMMLKKLRARVTPS